MLTNCLSGFDHFVGLALKGLKTNIIFKRHKYLSINPSNETLYAIWYHLHKLKNVTYTPGEVLLFVKLQAKSNSLPMVLFTFFKLHKWYQIAQSALDINYFRKLRHWGISGFTKPSTNLILRKRYTQKRSGCSTKVNSHRLVALQLLNCTCFWQFQLHLKTTNFGEHKRLFIILHTYEAYSGPFQITIMEPFAKIVKSKKTLFSFKGTKSPVS